MGSFRYWKLVDCPLSCKHTWVIPKRLSWNFADGSKELEDKYIEYKWPFIEILCAISVDSCLNKLLRRSWFCKWGLQNTHYITWTATIHMNLQPREATNTSIQSLTYIHSHSKSKGRRLGRLNHAPRHHKKKVCLYRMFLATTFN